MADGNAPMTSGKAISISRVAVIFGAGGPDPVEALRPVDLEIAPGEFVALVGPSGCGKSTLLNVLGGFIRPTSGRALIGGEEVLRPDIDHGMVFQDYALFPWLNVLQNVAFGLERQGVPRAERDARAMAMLRRVGLGDFATKRVRELSGGMKQRAAIARVFATDPSVILMDEPFGALDALTRRMLQEQLLEMWRGSGKTVVFVTHSVQEAIFLANRIVVMTARPGRIKTTVEVALEHPREFTSEPFRALERDVFAALADELRKSFSLETSFGGGVRD
jgi:ABC-type nitrate/sulfonate/bicarbonate transport system ATPase subunit